MCTAFGRFKPVRFVKENSMAKTLCVMFFFTMIMGFFGFKFPKAAAGSMFAMIAFTFMALKYPKTKLWKKMFVKK